MHFCSYSINTSIVFITPTATVLQTVKGWLLTLNWLSQARACTSTHLGLLRLHPYGQGNVCLDKRNKCFYYTLFILTICNSFQMKGPWCLTHSTCEWMELWREVEISFHAEGWCGEDENALHGLYTYTCAIIYYRHYTYNNNNYWFQIQTYFIHVYESCF